MREFRDRVAVVTGAAGGMGRAFAERFAREGMHVVLADSTWHSRPWHTMEPSTWCATIVHGVRTFLQIMLAQDAEGHIQPEAGAASALGVHTEKRMIKVLKGLLEFEGLSLGQLLEKIVLHSFASVPDYDMHRYRQFQDAGDPDGVRSHGGSK